MIALFIILMGLSGVSWAAPFVVSDPYTGSPAPTHCGVFLDSAPRVEIPISAEGTDVRCRYDVGGVGAGSHSITMTHILKDPVWGNLESAQSPPFVFARPAVPVAPSGLGLSP